MWISTPNELLQVDFYHNWTNARIEKERDTKTGLMFLFWCKIYIYIYINVFLLLFCGLSFARAYFHFCRSCIFIKALFVLRCFTVRVLSLQTDRFTPGPGPGGPGDWWRDGSKNIPQVTLMSISKIQFNFDRNTLLFFVKKKTGTSGLIQLLISVMRKYQTQTFYYTTLRVTLVQQAERGHFTHICYPHTHTHTHPLMFFGIHTHM